MTNTSPLVPEGIGHIPDRQASPSPLTIADHTRKLRSIMLYQGLDGVKVYKAEHPDAAACRIHTAHVVYVPKPAGYNEALASIVSTWFDSPTALAQTNRADVARLNAKLQTDRFDPDRHFSKPLSASALKSIATIFLKRGAVFSPPAKCSMTMVRKAVEASKQAPAPSGPVTRARDTVRIGSRTFPVKQHSGHDCIRIPVNGKPVRLRLDALTELIAVAGLECAGEVPDTLLRSKIREHVPIAENAPSDAPAQASPSGNVSQNADSLEEPHFSLAERIHRLCAASGSPPCADGVDALELAFQQDNL